MSSAPGNLVIGSIFNLIYTVLFGYIGFFLGKAIVWMVSLGRYPTRNPGPAQRVTMFLVGAIALVVTLVAVRNLIWP